MYNEATAYDEQRQYTQQPYHNPNVSALADTYPARYSTNNNNVHNDNMFAHPSANANNFNQQQQQPLYTARDSSAPSAYSDPYNATPAAMSNDPRRMPIHGQSTPSNPTTANQYYNDNINSNRSATNHNNNAMYPSTSDVEPVAPAPNAVDINGLRWTWSAYPNTTRTKPKEHTSAASVPLPEMIVPLACMYTPLTPLHSSAQVVLGDPDVPGQRCTQCGAYWCMHCQREESQNLWICMSCLHHNRLPIPYLAQHPALQYETVEYALPQDGIWHHAASAAGAAAAASPFWGAAGSRIVGQQVYLFVVDTCLPDEEFDMLRNALLRCVQWLPEHAFVGLITFAARACVWELGTSAMSACHVLRGDAPGAAMAEMLKITNNQNVLGRFIAPLGECIFTFTTLLEELQADTPPLPPNARALRTTATAMEAATVLIEFIGQSPVATIAAQSNAGVGNGANSAASSSVVGGIPSHPHYPSSLSHASSAAAAAGYDGNAVAHYHGRVVLFTGGPCTRGPGAVVSIDKSQIMRSHRDIMEDNIPLYAGAVSYYDGLALRLIRAHTCLDVFAESFDQVGVMEMRNCVNQTGGTMICGDAFTHDNFITTLERYFVHCGVSLNTRTDGISQNNNTNTNKNSNDKEGNVLVGGASCGDEGGCAKTADAANVDANTTMTCGYEVKMQIFTSFDTLVRGVIGPCTSNEEEINPTHRQQQQQQQQQSRLNSIVKAKDNGHDPTANTGRNAANRPADGLGNSRSIRGASSMCVGVGNTTNWRVSALSETTTYTYIFDTATIEVAQISDELPKFQPAHQPLYGSYQQPLPQNVVHSQRHSRRFIQFVTRYISSETQSVRVRITSIILPIPAAHIEAAYYIRNRTFDATCASTIIARMAISMLESYPNKWDEVKRWIDTLLVQFVRRYGTYILNRPESLKLDPSCALFPLFIFNLRRSEYFMVLNISPDETTFKRHWLMREPVDNCVRMIQPTLDSYDYDNPYATAVALDSCSLRDDNIILMDAFFNVHIMWGQIIFEWIKAGYHDQPEHAYFKELLENVEADAQNVLATRYPSPRFSRTDANGSEARHIKTRVNPTTTHASSDLINTPHDIQADLIYTDDASSSAFMQSLKNMVVIPTDVKNKNLNSAKTII